MTDADSKTIIKVENVNKIFKLPHERTNSIKGAILGILRGKKSFENQHVLKDISFEVKEGEFFGIVGRNGSGKSTLLKLLAGIYEPTSGSMHVGGKLTPFIELGVGFNPELTGRENVFLNGALLGFSRKEMLAMYDDIVAFAELSRFMDQKLKNYSSGMQVRLAFSIAIRAETDILLIDEVLAVGDAAFQQKCYDYFKGMKKQKKTIVFISHDMGAVKQFCDRSIAIEGGKITCTGTNYEVTNYYKNLLLNPKNTKPSTPRHRGVNALTIDNVVIRNSKNKAVKNISSAEPFSISFDYKNNEDIKECTFGVGIVNRQDVNVVGPNTKQSLGKMVQLKKQGTVTCAFEPTNLTKGMYEVLISAFNEDESTPYDYVENAAVLTVKDNDIYGVVTADCDWSFS